jgi:hypothetical protein
MSRRSTVFTGFDGLEYSWRNLKTPLAASSLEVRDSVRLQPVASPSECAHSAGPSRVTRSS